MTSIPKSDELIFVKNYYNVLCNRPSTIQQYYMKESQLTIGREADRPEICTEEFGRYIKSKMPNPVSKVLISHLSYQKVDDLRSIINVVGQLVHGDATHTRMAHQFVVMRTNSVLYIKNEILTFLDEEVVYETGDAKRTVVVDYGKGKIAEAVGAISEFGSVESMRVEGEGRVVMVVSSAEDIESIKKNVAKIISQGYKVEFDGLKI